MEKTAVTVKIFNDEYTLKTDLPRTDVDAIAAMVDKKMQKRLLLKKIKRHLLNLKIIMI